MDETIQSLEVDIAELEHELDQAGTDGLAANSSEVADIRRRITDMDALLSRLHASGAHFPSAPHTAKL